MAFVILKYITIQILTDYIILVMIVFFFFTLYHEYSI